MGITQTTSELLTLTNPPLIFLSLTLTLTLTLKSLPSAPQLAHPCPPMHRSWIFQEKAIKRCRQSSGILGLDVVLLMRAPDSLPPPRSQVNLYYFMCIVQVPMFHSEVAQVCGRSFGRTTNDAIPPPAFQPHAHPTAHLASIPAPCMPTHTPTPLPTHPALLFPHPYTRVIPN